MNKQPKTLLELRDSQIVYDKNPPAFGYILILIVLTLMIGILIWSLLTPKVYIVKGNGISVSLNKNYIMPAYAGEISNINVKDGSYVETGEALFSIKSTDLNLQKIQVDGKITIDQQQISQLQKLEKSIIDGVNYFDANNPDDKQYYDQYEEYQSQVQQNIVDISTYKQYGYTDDQIKNQIEINNGKISEIYYSTLKTVDEDIDTAKSDMENMQVQSEAISAGESDYTVTASVNGIVHLSTDYNVGMVVQAGSIMGSVVQENDGYVIEAYISATDAPLIKVGNPVDIAVSGLNESVYGTISGKLVYINNDITTNTNNNGDSDSSNDNESYCKIDVSLDSLYLVSKSGAKYNITDGTVVETRIQYDELSYFDYFLNSLGVLTR